MYNKWDIDLITLIPSHISMSLLRFVTSHSHTKKPSTSPQSEEPLVKKVRVVLDFYIISIGIYVVVTLGQFVRFAVASTQPNSLSRDNTLYIAIGMPLTTVTSNLISSRLQ